MAYRNTIISLASLVALGTACSKAPTYDQATKTGTVQNANGEVGADGNDHTHPPLSTDQVAANTPAPAVDTPKAPDAVKPATPPAPPAAAPLKADPVKQMANNTLFTVSRVTNPVGWNTTVAAPATVNVAVDAAGAAIRSTMGETIVKLNPEDPNQLLDANGVALKPATLQSLYVVCNDQAKAIRLHSATGGAPFAHQGGQIAQGTCVALPAVNAIQETLDSTKAGATYDHILGQAAANNVYLKTQKISPAGAIVP